MSFKNELEKIKAAEEAKKRAEQEAIEQTKEFIEAKNRAKYADQLSAYLNEHVRPILEEVKDVMNYDDGEIREIRLCHQDGSNINQYAYMGLHWEQSRDDDCDREGNPTGRSVERGNKIGLSIYPPFNLILSSGHGYKEKTYSLKDDRWVEKIEKDIAEIIKDKKYHYGGY